MRIADQVTVPVPRERVWDSFLDGAVLVRAIPGCDRLVGTAEHEYDMTVTAGVAAVRGTYEGHCRLGDLVERESLVMRLTGAGTPGTVDATVRVTLADDAEGGTTVAYDADATVGGMVGGVGQRMLTSVSRRMAREFFGNLAAVVTAEAAAADGAEPVGGAQWAPGTAGAPGMPAVYTDAVPGLAPGGFWAGVATGAGLVLLGMAAGAAVSWSRK